MSEILIKKYDNRRLYCVNEGRYVSLPEIRDFVRDGREVRVVEKASGRDITKFILTQILLEERCEHIPLSFFRLMIQSQPGTLDLFFTQVFPRMTEAFDAWRKRGPFGALPGFPPAAGFPASSGFPAPFPWMGGRDDSPGATAEPAPESKPEPAPPDKAAAKPARKAPTRPQDRAAEPAPPAASDHAAPAADPRVEELMKRLADLESRVQGKGKRRR